MAHAAPVKGQVTVARTRDRLLVVTGLVIVVVVLDSSGLLSPRAEIVVDDVAQLAAGVAAAACCWWAARRRTGVERTWRLLMALGMAGWSVGQSFWSWYQIFSRTPLPSPSVADIGYLTMPVFALPALLVLEVAPSDDEAALRRAGRPGLLLDGAIVVGSLFMLTWVSSLGAVVAAEAPDMLSFAVAIAYPVTDLVLVAIVVLLVVTRRVPPEVRHEVTLLGWGVVAISISDSIFAYLVASGAESMPPLTNVGFIAGPALIAVAGLTRSDQVEAARAAPRRPAVDRTHMLLPYGLAVLTGSVVMGQLAFGAEIDAAEVIIVWLIVMLVLARQAITLLENATLLDRLAAARAELSYRADHDPLTGLANRSLFEARLGQAVDRYRCDGRPLAVLVVDLDDFKQVNDTLGHSAGDHLLYAVGERLRGCVRSGDTVARVGGDEFAVVVGGDPLAPAIVSERILAAMRREFAVGDDVVVLGASVGVVEPRPDEPDVTAEVLVQRADRAMYAGKRQGKGTVVHFRDGAPVAAPAGVRPDEPGRRRAGAAR